MTYTVTKLELTHTYYLTLPWIGLQAECLHSIAMKCKFSIIVFRLFSQIVEITTPTDYLWLDNHGCLNSPTYCKRIL